MRTLPRIAALGLVLAGCDALEPDCNIRPDVMARDTTVAAFDTVRLHAESEDPCGKSLRYLWSFDSGETYDTTATGTLVKTFGRADIGRKSLRIRALNDQGKVSSATNITITVEERRFAWRPARDTLIHFGDSIARVDLTPAIPISGIASYCLRPYAFSACSDSSLAPVFPLKSSRSLYGLQSFLAEVRLASGGRSDTARYTVLSRPTMLGMFSGYAMKAAPLGNGSLRVLVPSVADTGMKNPRSGGRLSGIRALEIDATGKVVSERISRPPLDLSLGTLALRADGTGLFLGRDNLAPETSDFVAGNLDRDGTVSWTRTYDLDTSFANALAAYPNADGTWRVVMSGYASVGGGNGKPAVHVATAIHYIDLSASGEVLKDNRVVVPGLAMDGLRTCRLPDGGTVISGAGAPEGSRAWSPLVVFRHDAGGVEVWSKTFRSQVGASRANLLEATSEGNLILSGSDYGDAVSHWILRLDPADGHELSTRIVVRPTGWSFSGPVRNIQGTLLHSGNRDGASMLWATDGNGLEKWRLLFAKGMTDAHLSGPIPLPDGSFLVTGEVMLGPYRNDPGAVVFRVDADGRIAW